MFEPDPDWWHRLPLAPEGTLPPETPGTRDVLISLGWTVALNAHEEEILTIAQPVGLDALRGELEGVQAQVEKLCAGVADRQVGTMRLNGLQVSLGITAQGSIGVVTAGMQASLTLVYERATG